MSGGERILDYRIDGHDVTVALDDGALVTPAQRLYQAYLVDASREREPVLRVTSVGEGYVITRPGRADVQCDDAETAFAEYEYALTEALLEASVGAAQVHAAGAVVQGRALLALGKSGAGKSSIATTFSVRGVPVLGDDIVLIDGQGRARPFKRLFKVSAELLWEHEMETTRDSTYGLDDGETWFDPTQHGGWGEPAPVGLIVVLRHRPAAPTWITPVPKADVLNLLMHSLMTSGVTSTVAFDWLAAITEQAAAFEVSFSAAHAAVDELLARVP